MSWFEGVCLVVSYRFFVPPSPWHSNDVAPPRIQSQYITRSNSAFPSASQILNISIPTAVLTNPPTVSQKFVLGSPLIPCLSPVSPNSPCPELQSTCAHLMGLSYNRLERAQAESSAMLGYASLGVLEYDILMHNSSFYWSRVPLFF